MSLKNTKELTIIRTCVAVAWKVATVSVYCKSEIFCEVLNHVVILPNLHFVNWNEFKYFSGLQRGVVPCWWLGEHNFRSSYQLPTHSVFSLSPSSVPGKKGWGPYWGAQVGWSRVAGELWCRCVEGKGEGSDSHLFSFSFWIRRRQFMPPIHHGHFSSLCTLLVSVTYCWETEFNQWTPVLLINTVSCSL